MNANIRLFLLLLALPAEPAVATPAPNCAALFVEREVPSPIPFALLPNGKIIAPIGLMDLYHGTRRVDPEDALRFGLPSRGDNLDLLAHSNGGKDSAFRGTTAHVSDPVRETGAAYWAGEGGWVFKVEAYAFDVNAALAGRVKRGTEFGNNNWRGENEYAIPAYVPPTHIVRYGQVKQSLSGKLYVPIWIENPRYIPRHPRH